MEMISGNVQTYRGDNINIIRIANILNYFNRIFLFSISIQNLVHAYRKKHTKIGMCKYVSNVFFLNSTFSSALKTSQQEVLA